MQSPTRVPRPHVEIAKVADRYQYMVFLDWPDGRRMAVPVSPDSGGGRTFRERKANLAIACYRAVKESLTDLSPEEELKLWSEIEAPLKVALENLLTPFNPRAHH
jgi:hypothetical protein